MSLEERRHRDVQGSVQTKKILLKTFAISHDPEALASALSLANTDFRELKP